MISRDKDSQELLHLPKVSSIWATRLSSMSLRRVLRLCDSWGVELFNKNAIALMMFSSGDIVLKADPCVSQTPSGGVTFVSLSVGVIFASDLRARCLRCGCLAFQFVGTFFANGSACPFFPACLLFILWRAMVVFPCWF